MKTCFKCGIEKESQEFYKHKGNSDGLLGKCKECTKNDNRANLAKVGDAIDSTIHGVI